MSEFELHTLISDLLRDMHQTIHFWLLCTFTVVTARYVGRRVLRQSVLRIATFFYLVITVATLARLTAIGGRETVYRDGLIALGHDPFPTNVGAVGVMLLGYLVLTVLGTVAAVYLLLWHRPEEGV